MTKTSTQCPAAPQASSPHGEDAYPLHILLPGTEVEEAAHVRSLQALEWLVSAVLADERIDQEFRTPWQTLGQLLDQARPAWAQGWNACRERVGGAAPGPEAMLQEAVVRAEAVCGTFNERYWYVAVWMTCHREER
jgi:hypothetical protein